MWLSIGTKIGALYDIERRNGRVVCVILPNLVDFWGLSRKSG